MRATLLGLLLLGAGFGLGWLARPGSEGGVPDPGAAALARLPPPPSRAEHPPALPGSSSATLEGVRAEDLAPYRALLAALPPVQFPAGHGVITGSVTTERGEAVAGVTVTLYPAREPTQARPGGPSEERPALEEMVRSQVEGLRRRELGRRETVTGADGSFRFDEVADGQHATSARLDGWRIQATDPRLANAAEPGVEVAFRAVRMSSLALDVRLPDGTRPESARGDCRSGSQGWGISWSPSRPLVELEPGLWEVRVVAGADEEYTGEPVSVELGPGETKPLTVTLASRPVLKGRIVTPEGESFEGGEVWLQRLTPGGKVDPAALTTSGQQAMWRYDGLVAHFRFTDLAPGRYALGASRAGQGRVVVTAEVDVGEGVTTQDLAIPPLGREEYFVLHVTGPDGGAVAHVTVGLEHRSEHGSSSGGATVLERQDGSRWVLHATDTAAAQEGGRSWVRVESNAYGVRRVAYDRLRAREVTVRFDRPCSLTVEVRGLVGSPYEGRLSVRLESAGEGAGSGRSLTAPGPGRPDDRGRLILPRLQPGEFDLVLLLSERFRSWPVARQRIAVRGDASVSVDLPPLYGVTLAGASGRAWVQPRDGGGWSAHGTVDAQGRAVFEGLPAGTYFAGSQDGRRATFTLPGPSEVELTQNESSR